MAESGLNDYSLRMTSLLTKTKGLKKIWSEIKSYSDDKVRAKLLGFELSGAGSMLVLRERLLRHEARVLQASDVPWCHSWDVLGELPIGIMEADLVMGRVTRASASNDQEAGNGDIIDESDQSRQHVVFTPDPPERNAANLGNKSLIDLPIDEIQGVAGNQTTSGNVTQGQYGTNVPVDITPKASNLGTGDWLFDDKFDQLSTEDQLRLMKECIGAYRLRFGIPPQLALGSSPALTNASLQVNNRPGVVPGNINLLRSSTPADGLLGDASKLTLPNNSGISGLVVQGSLSRNASGQRHVTIADDQTVGSGRSDRKDEKGADRDDTDRNDNNDRNNRGSRSLEPNRSSRRSRSRSRDRSRSPRDRYNRRSSRRSRSRSRDRSYSPRNSNSGRSPRRSRSRSRDRSRSPWFDDYSDYSPSRSKVSRDGRGRSRDRRDERSRRSDRDYSRRRETSRSRSRSPRTSLDRERFSDRGRDGDGDRRSRDNNRSRYRRSRSRSRYSDRDRSSDRRRRSGHRSRSGSGNRLSSLLKGWSQLHFNGDSDKDNAAEFMRDMEVFRRTLRLSDRDSLSVLPLILRGTAKRWWSVASDTVRTWSELRRKFRHRFIGDYNSDDIKEELKARTQGEKELIEEFLQNFGYIAKFFPRIPREHKLTRIAFKNLLPEYREAMADKRINSREDIAYYGRKFERLKRMDRDYTPPPSRDRARIPGAAYNPNRSRKRGVEIAEVKVSNSRREHVSRSRTQSRNRDRSRQRAGEGGKRNNERSVEEVACTQDHKSKGYESQHRSRERSLGRPQRESNYNTPRTPTPREPRSSSVGFRTPSTSSQSPFYGECSVCKQLGHRAKDCVDRICNYCKGKGHWVPECPIRPRRTPPQDTGQTVSCQGCGKEGYTLNRCPRCVEIWKKFDSEN